MFLDIGLRQNSTPNSTNSSVSFVYNAFTKCKDMYEGTVFWACFTLVSVLCGFPACVAVLWELLQRHRRGVSATPNDVFMLSLTVMDLVYLSFSPLGVFNSLFWHIWPIEDLFRFLATFTMIGRPLFMTCICLDCYLAVVHPITYRARKGLASRVLASISVWAFTLVYGALAVRFPQYMIYGNALLDALAMLTIGICDFFILRALKSSDPGGRDLHPQKKKALQIIINSLVITVISYLPPILPAFFQPLMSQSLEFICRVLYPLSSTVIAGSAIMPVLYLANLKELDFSNCWCCKAV